MHDEDGGVAELDALDPATGRGPGRDPGRGVDGGADTAALQAELAQLRTALTRRPVIDMAKGAIMALTRCDEDTAFRQLSEVSQAHNVKLYDLATALLLDLRRTGAAPGQRGGDSGGDGGRDGGRDGAADREVDRLVQRNWTRR